MTRITPSMTARGVLSDITAANARLSKTQRQLSSGKQLTRPSDDAPAVVRALQYRKDIEGTQQFQRNSSDAQGWADVTDAALRTINDALQRARELTVQGATESAGPDARTAITEELKGVVDTVKTAANANYGGRYVFAGSKTDTKPYELGTSDAYAGDVQPLTSTIGPGVNLQINVDGPSAIGTGTSGLLGSLRGVLAHLASGDTASLTNDLKALDTNLDSLNAVRATVGATANRLEIASGRLADYEGTVTKLLNDTESVDVAKAMIDFSTQQAAMTAGLKAGSSIVQNSLLDFLR